VVVVGTKAIKLEAEVRVTWLAAPVTRWDRGQQVARLIRRDRSSGCRACRGRRKVHMVQPWAAVMAVVQACPVVWADQGTCTSLPAPLPCLLWVLLGVWAGPWWGVMLAVAVASFPTRAGDDPQATCPRSTRDRDRDQRTMHRSKCQCTVAVVAVVAEDSALGGVRAEDIPWAPALASGPVFTESGHSAVSAAAAALVLVENTTRPEGPWGPPLSPTCTDPTAAGAVVVAAWVAVVAGSVGLAARCPPSGPYEHPCPKSAAAAAAGSTSPGMECLSTLHRGVGE
jgi:hypothetical protein